MEAQSKKDLIAKMIDCDCNADGLGRGDRSLGRVRYYSPVKKYPTT